MTEQRDMDEELLVDRMVNAFFGTEAILAMGYSAELHNHAMEKVLAVVRQHQWINIDEKQPAVGQWVLVSYFTWGESCWPRGYTVACRDEFNNWTLSIPNPELTHAYPPTHWQPFSAIHTRS